MKNFHIITHKKILEKNKRHALSDIYKHFIFFCNIFNDKLNILITEHAMSN